LESLDLKQTQVTDFPKQIDEIYNLRHLLGAYRHDIKNYVTFGAVQGVEVSAGNVGALARIQKLSLIKVNKNRNIIKALGELKSLKRLGLIDLKREDGGELCSTVKKMVNLSTFDVQSTSEDEILDLDQMQSSPGPPLYLQHLYLKGRLEGVPKWVRQLRSLSKVGLKWSKLKATENPLEALEALPSLMELELADYYTGKELIFKSETFQKLMILSIDKFDELNFMKVESKAIPMLKKLTLSRCRNLELLPVFCTGDLKSLEELLLYDMCNEFIAKLENDGEDREVFQHVGVIESLSLGSNQHFTGYKNLSPSQWHVRS
jgi:disease resistance protein RPM1